MKKGLPMRTRVLLGTLAVVAVLALVSTVQSTMLRNELFVHAQELADANRGDGEESAFTVTVARPFVLFGEPIGKVTTFSRPVGAETNEVLMAVDYQFVKQDGKWINTESAMCMHDGCITGAESAFAHAGHDH